MELNLFQRILVTVLQLENKRLNQNVFLEKI